MDIGSIQPTNPFATGQTTPAGDQGKTVISSDFETFIKMLTVQMENQDPLNPVDATDFAVQLAQFSTVEQQVLTNSLLTNLGAQIGALSVAQLSGWVGMQARAEMPVAFEGAPVTLTLRPDSLAESAELVVRNEQGAEVSRQPAPTETGEFDWAGTDADGTPLPYGTYALSVESFSSGQLIATAPVEVHSLIVEARNDNGVPTLVMAGGQVVTAAQILGLSEPASRG